jgi:hypothetical protein
MILFLPYKIFSFLTYARFEIFFLIKGLGKVLLFISL